MCVCVCVRVCVWVAVSSFYSEKGEGSKVLPAPLLPLEVWLVFLGELQKLFELVA